MSAKAAVIISFYNNSDLLRRALWGYAAQDRRDFRIIIADDGSRQDEVEAATAAARESSLDVTHLWHEDNGFRKAKILNEAIVHADVEPLIFVDADMIPRRDFVSSHLRLLRPNYYISGGSHLHLPAGMHGDITPAVVESGELFEWRWLQCYDVEARRFKLRLGKSGLHARIMDAIFVRPYVFVGCNASCWRSDALAVNGFDEDWGYGGTDREFGLRLTNAGVKSRRHQFSLVALHQEHGRPYRDPQKVRHNKMMLKKLFRSGKSWVEQGIDRRQQPDAQVLYRTAKDNA